MTAEAAIRGVVQALAEAWNRQDWIALATLFTEDAEYVTATGDRLVGRARIRQGLSARATARAGPAEVSINEHSVRLLRSDIGVVLCGWRMAAAASPRGDRARARAGILTLVLTDGVDGWRIETLHNTDTAGPSAGGA
jgi:uncharacterized protein (TIGR02246 family)